MDVGIYPLWLYCDIVTSLGGKITLLEIKGDSEQYQVSVDDNVELLFTEPVRGELKASTTQ